MLLDGKTVVVSGVGPGLGREIAVAAAREGANVVLAARREDNLRAVAEEMAPDGKRVAWQPTDITDAGQVESLLALTAERVGTGDGVVNCAALASVLGGFEATSERAWRKVFEVNVFGTMNVVRAALPLLKQQGGAIVFI